MEFSDLVPKVGERIFLGAEAELLTGEYLDKKIIIKRRIPKKYRLPQLDTVIRTQRTKYEARILNTAFQEGISVPQVWFVNLNNTEIYMDAIMAPSLKESISDHGSTHVFNDLGQEVANLHNSNIIHGDLTTSNVLVDDTKIYIIDFGLAKFSNDIEDKSVDLMVLKRTLESTHTKIYQDAWNEFLKGYLASSNIDTPQIIKRLEDIEYRARYKSH